MSADETGQSLEFLESQPWEEVIPRLLVYASKKSKRLFWRGVYGGHLPEGNEIIDLVQEAVEKVLTGQRNWNTEVYPDLFSYLKSVVDSELSHLADRLDNKHVRRDTVTVQAGDCGEDEQEVSLIGSHPTPSPHPEEAYLLREEEDRCEKFFWGFYESLEGKPFLQKIVECIWDDVVKRAEIASKLGVPASEVDNARKQLQRRLDEYRKSN